MGSRGILCMCVWEFILGPDKDGDFPHVDLFGDDASFFLLLLSLIV